MTSVMYGHLDVSNDLSMKRIITGEAFAHLPRPIAALHLCRIYSLPDTKLVIYLSCVICPKGIHSTPIFTEIRVWCSKLAFIQVACIHLAFSEICALDKSRVRKMHFCIYHSQWRHKYSRLLDLAPRGFVLPQYPPTKKDGDGRAALLMRFSTKKKMNHTQ